MMTEQISQKTAKILLKIGAVSFRFNPPFTFTSGLKSPIYLDNRIIMSYPNERETIINFYVETLKRTIGLENISYISGTATAAVPQASWVAGKLHLPMVYVRPSTKSYGKGNKLEGYLKKGSEVIIIEDHVSTATSIVNNAQTIRDNGGKVSFCIATTTYETKESIDALQTHHIKLFALATGRDILMQAFQAKVINGEEKKKVELWLKNLS